MLHLNNAKVLLSDVLAAAAVVVGEVSYSVNWWLKGHCM